MEFHPTPETIQAALQFAAQSPWHVAHAIMWPSTPEGRELADLREEVRRLRDQLAAAQSERSA